VKSESLLRNVSETAILVAEYCGTDFGRTNFEEHLRLASSNPVEFRLKELELYKLLNAKRVKTCLLD
jgi:hypothetical protein